MLQHAPYGKQSERVGYEQRWKAEDKSEYRERMGVQVKTNGLGHDNRNEKDGKNYASSGLMHGERPDRFAASVTAKMTEVKEKNEGRSSEIAKDKIAESRLTEARRLRQGTGTGVVIKACFHHSRGNRQ